MQVRFTGFSPLKASPLGRASVRDVAVAAIMVSTAFMNPLAEAVTTPVSQQLAKPQAPSAVPTTEGKTFTYRLKDLGAARPLEFRGVEHSTWLPLSMRLDETVVSAKLKLNFTFSPSLLADLSQIKVMVNEEALATIQASKVKLGVPQTIEIDLDPRYFTEFAKLRLEFIGHYTMDCEFPFHTSLWASVSNESTLEVVTRALPLRNDLASLPAPFFDHRDARTVVIPMLMAGKPSTETIRDAGVLATWFGSLAGFRGARFPVGLQESNKRHAIVLATNDERPDGLNLPKVEIPTIAMVANPTDPTLKMMLVMGKNAAQLQTAVQALVLGQATLSGDKAEVTTVKLPDRRPAYEAPNVLRTGTKVRIGDLVTSANELQTRGVFLDPIRVNMRVPPDIFTWQSKGVPVDLRYRYTPPRDWGLAHMGIQINDGLIESVALKPADREGAAKVQRAAALPFMSTQGLATNLAFSIPSNQLFGARQFKVNFEIPPVDEGKCRTTYLSGSQAAVDPDSTIDLTGLEHYATMPNLGFFADSGFPFTKFADLAETALIIADAPRPEELEAALNTLGHFGASTGAAGTRLSVFSASKTKDAGDRDLLVIATGTQVAPLSDWGQSLPARFDSAKRSTAGLQRVVSAGSEWFTRDEPRQLPKAGWSDIQTQGPLGAFMGFESPIAKGRSVVALNVSDASVYPLLTRALSDPAKNPLMRGDLSLVRGDTVESFRVGDEYQVGNLSWWRWTWYRLHSHPILLGLLCVVGGLLVALVLFSLMRGVAARRLDQKA